VEFADRIVKRNPADGSVVLTIAVATEHEVDRAVQRARAALPDWARTAAAARAAALSRAADAVETATDQLADLTTREMGRPVAESRAGVEAGVSTLRQYAQLGPLHRGRTLAGDWSATDLMVYEPRGVAAVITPWNDPVAVSCGLLGAALVTGNTVVYKPSERTPGTGRLLASLLAEALPPDVLVDLAGGPGVGDRLVHAEVDVVAHVGSSATGRRIALAAAGTGAKVILENGGKDPLLVDADVDPAWAAEQAAIGAFANVGQICTSVERIFVHRDVAEEFLTALTEQARGRNRPGGQAPLVDTRMRADVHRQVEAALTAGARLLEGGRVPEGPGAYYPATVISDCPLDSEVMTEETFGPVAPVRVVDDFATALGLATADRYGLAATVLSGSLDHVAEAIARLPVGTVKINAVFGGAPGGAAQPRGDSGAGFGYGPELLDEMTTRKVVHVGRPVLRR